MDFFIPLSKRFKAFVILTLNIFCVLCIFIVLNFLRTYRLHFAIVPVIGLKMVKSGVF